MDSLTFLRTVFSSVQGNVYLWTLPDKRTHMFGTAELKRMADTARELSGQKRDVYYGLGVTARRLGVNERPKNTDIIALTALWADIDVAHPQAHKAANLPPNIDSAMRLLPDRLPPSIIVHSGYGLHVYWLLSTPWTLADDAQRQQAKLLLQHLQQYIRSAATANGWTIDPTADLSRIMRLPGTWNFKLPTAPVLCEVIESSERRYALSDVMAAIETTATGPTTASAGFERRPTDGPVRYMLQNCRFLQHWQLHYKSLPEPVWMAAITNIARGVGGEDIILTAARDWLGDKYDEAKTRKKIQHALTECGPQTCQYIQTTLGFTCPPGGCGVTAPCGWSLGKVARARAIVRSLPALTPENIFDPVVIGALAVLEHADRAEYAQFKARCRGRVNLRDLSAAIREHTATKRQSAGLTVIQGGAGAGAVTEGQQVGNITTAGVLPESPIDLIIPTNFAYGADGVYALRQTSDGMTIRQRAAGVPVVITERLYNLDTGNEKIEITFRYYNSWRRVVQPRSTVFNARQVVKLTDYGLSTSSESAKHLVRWLEALEAANLDLIPLVHSVSRVGWRDHTREFVLPSTQGAGGYRLDVDDCIDVLAAYQCRGDLAGWLAVAQQVRQHPVARFVLAASFAAPLLKILNHRNFLVYLWGTTGGGKTAALVWALSVWGVPQQLMVSFLATLSGMERRLAVGNDLPAGINERQSAGSGREKQEWLERVVYMLEGGRGKLRATKTGLQNTLYWRTIGLATGEEPLSRESSIGGVKTRVLEINSYPVVPEALAKQIYLQSDRHCGVAGTEYVSRLMTVLREDPAAVYDAYTALQQILTADYPAHLSVHVDAVTCVALADYLASQWLFGLARQQAEQEAYDLARAVLDELPTRRDVSDLDRGWDFVQNWLAANHTRFESEVGGEVKAGPIYGFYRDGHTCIYPEALTSAMSDAGFAPDKLLREFANAGKIMTATESGERRFKIRVRHQGQSVRVIMIPGTTGNTPGTDI